MTLTKIWLINILTSLTILAILLLFPLEIVDAIGNFLLALNHPMEFFHVSIYDAIIISLIPIVSFFQYSNKSIIHVKTIIFANLFTIVSLLIVCIITYIFLVQFSKPSSPLIPGYVVNVPFPKFFWKPIFITGIIIPIILKRTLLKNA
jgi:hypothetical protein